MIDNFKINNLSIGLNIENLLDFKIQVNKRTGEELTEEKRSANLKNLTFTITPGDRFVKVQGSLHYFANGGEQKNNDRFTFDRFVEVTKELKDYISPDDIINFLEFGVNIHTPFDPSDFIDNLIAHRNRQFNKSKDLGAKKHYSECGYRHYIIKIYNKSLQQGPSGAFILRVEAKYLRMQKLFPNGLKWSDLGKVETWHKLGEVLKEKFSDVIYYDPSIDLNKAPEKERQFIKAGYNPFYWEKLKGSHTARTREQYKKLIGKYGSKFNNLPELLDQEIEKVAKSYHYFDSENDPLKSDSCKKVANCYPLLPCNFSPPQQTTSTNRVNCCVTGIDISIQRPGSKFLCISGIRWLFMTDPATFEKLKSERLSAKWHNSTLDIQFREICHSVRNEYFNPRHNTTRAIMRLSQYPNLFDNYPLIREDKRQIAGIN